MTGGEEGKRKGAKSGNKKTVAAVRGCLLPEISSVRGEEEKISGNACERGGPVSSQRHWPLLTGTDHLSSPLREITPDQYSEWGGHRKRKGLSKKSERNKPSHLF